MINYVFNPHLYTLNINQWKIKKTLTVCADNYMNHVQEITQSEKDHHMFIKARTAGYHDN